ncbi:hypothetical protein [Hyalangium versicolor]|uniref:hypothetical protein n=1 Tax=Hyalangium versicolor TaxID=2861190 RepID=UPI001CCE1A8A|nr:hypothetical protein [Hyalangium versicolor]
MAKPSIQTRKPLHESDEGELLQLAAHLLGKAREVLQHVQLPLSRRQESGSVAAAFESGRVRSLIDQVTQLRKETRDVRRSLREVRHG